MSLQARRTRKIRLE